MPIKPPQLDDRSFDDLVREARALIPQYCPEWTNLSDADPGMTLVQLFAWMTEMTLFRLNRVPDKTYVHFLNFIGEDRRTAKPAVAPLTFSLREGAGASAEIPAHTRCSTRQQPGGDALHFLTDGPLTVHGARIDRVVAVAAGEVPLVREVPFDPHPLAAQGIRFARGEGVQLLELDPVADGPHSHTPDHWVYLRHEDILAMARDAEADGGRLRLRSVGEPGLPVAALFDWEYPRLDDGEATWTPVPVESAPDVMGLPEVLLHTVLPGLTEVPHLGDDTPVPLPEGLDPRGWIRGRVRFERWLAHLMEEELHVTWRDDRGGDEREITNWFVRDVGHTVELFVQNLPPIRAGWSLRLTLVDHGLRAGRDGLFPRYRWSWRRGDRWMPIPDARVQQLGASFVLTGPFPDMASDGFNLRAERVETVDLEGILPGLEAELVWRRPVEVALASGAEADAAAPLPTSELPAEPFQPMPTLPAMLGMKLFLGGDVLANRAREPVLLEVDVGFERDGELVEEPVDDYHLQLTCRTATGWRVVHDDARDYSRFTFADLDPDGAKQPGRRILRFRLDPVAQLDDLAPVTIAGRRTRWLRLELTRAALTHQEDKKSPAVPVSLRVFDVRLGLDAAVGAPTWDEPLPGARLVALEHRGGNRRLSRVQRRHEGEVVSHTPFDPILTLHDDDGRHHALYLRFDRPLPMGHRLATLFRTRGETWLPEGVRVHWELLEAAGEGHRWTRLGADHAAPYTLERSGVLAFGLDEPMAPSPHGVWVRAVFRHDHDEALPPLPPVAHILPNTVEAANLHEFRMEKASGEGIPGQVMQLRHFPVHLGDDDATALRVLVEEDDGERRPWRVAPGNRLATATRDDRCFVVDPVEGTLTFGNGLRGRMLPVGAFNVVVERYHTVPGAAGNVGAGEVGLVEGFGDLVEVTNPLPATGGRHAESIDEIIRRAPSILTSRDRAVTRQDFEAIAEEASAEVARAACVGELGDDGVVDVVILPRRRADEPVPDPFLSAGLRDHVQAHLARRCLVNVRPAVRLATFLPLDVSVDLRLRPRANRVRVREEVTAWVRRFLDPYRGGLDGEGWPFRGALYAQDFGRLVRDLPDVRHVAGVRLFRVDDDDLRASPGWDSAEGAEVLRLDHHDLFQLREVRVRWTEEPG